MKGKRGMTRLLHTNNGRYAISFILGIGLASLFRKVCNDINCIEFRAPSFSEVTKNVYKHNNDCYTFNEKSTTCGKNKIVPFA